MQRHHVNAKGTDAAGANAARLFVVAPPSGPNGWPFREYRSDQKNGPEAKRAATPASCCPTSSFRHGVFAEKISSLQLRSPIPQNL